MLEKPAEVLRFKAGYRKGREVATVNRALSTLRAAINRGRFQDPPYLATTPFHRFGVTIKSKEETKRDRRIGLHEEQALLAASGQMDGVEHKYVGSAIHDRIIGALETCCRRGEMLRIQNRRVDWERHQIAIPVVMRRMRRIAAFHSTHKDAWRPSSSAARLSARTRTCSDRRPVSSWRTTPAVAVLCLLLSHPPVARADVVLEWNEILVNTLAGQNPLVSSRVAAITHTTVFEAVNAITEEYQPYLFTIEGPPGASPEAAAVAAAHAVLVHFFPDPARVEALNAFRDNSLAAIPDGPSKTTGIAVGQTAAAAIIAARANDGSGMPAFFLPTSSNPGEWQLTPACPPAGGVFFHAPNITPFGIQSSSQFRAAPPPALTSNAYARDYEEVKTVGAADSIARPADRADVAEFYNALFPVPLWRTSCGLRSFDGSAVEFRETVCAEEIPPAGDNAAPC